MIAKAKRNVFRRLSFDLLEDRRVLAAGWNIIDIPDGPIGQGIDQPADGSLITLIRDDRTERLRPNGEPRVPKYRLPSDAPDQIFGTVASPYVVQDGQQNIVDMRFRFPANENVSGVQVISLDSDERIQDVIPWIDNGAAIPAEVPAIVECFNYDTGISRGTDCGPARIVATAEPIVGTYFDGVDFMLVDGPLTGAGGPENFDRFAYFVPSATVTPTGGSTVVREGGGADTVNVRIDSTLARPDLVGNDAWGVELRIRSSDPSQLEILTPTLALNHVNFPTGVDIQVRALDDALVDGTRNANILISVEDIGGDGFASSDKLFDSYEFAPVPVTILDNDANITVAPPAVPSTVEGSGNSMDIVIDRSGTTDTELDIPFTIGGTADKGVDYQLVGAQSMSGNNGTVRFTPGQTVATLQFIETDDVMIEPTESIVVSFADGITYNFDTNPMVNMSILDNDPGDFDSDGDYDCDDINVLSVNIVANSNDLTYDVNRDGSLNQLDIEAWLAEAGARNLMSGAPYLPADMNLDGTVDGVDFTIWNENRFTNNPNWCDGDLNADGAVDGLDFIIWNDNRFQSSPFEASDTPESKEIELRTAQTAVLPDHVVESTGRNVARRTRLPKAEVSVVDALWAAVNTDLLD